MICAGCQRELEEGDRYIKDTPGGFLGHEIDHEIDGMMAELLGGSGGEIIYCEDCTEPGGEYVFEIVGEEDA